MTDQSFRDDVLDAVLRSRAGEGTPPDLHAQIRAAVAAERRRVGTRRSIGRPWRLLAVAAVLLTTIGTALFVSGSRTSELTPTPGPSLLAVTNPSPQAALTPDPSPADPSQPASSPSPSPAALGASSPSCTKLREDAQQAGVTTGPWDVAKVGAPGAVANGLIATDVGIDSKSLRLVDPITGTSRKIAAFGNEYVSILGWSPSGSALAFAASINPVQPGGCTGLFVWSPSGTVEVAYQRQILDVAWSPTGSAVAYVAFGGDRTAHLIAAGADGSSRDLGSICGACSFIDTPSWSPDGTRIAATWMTEDQSDSRLSILDVQAGKWTVVPHSSGYRLGDSRFNTGGGSGWLDASTLLVGNVTIALDKAGMPRTRVSWPPIDAGTVSPNLKWATNLGCSRCVVTVTSQATGRTHQIWDSTAVNVAWSPDSRQLVVFVGHSVTNPGLWVINVDGTGLHRITRTIPTRVDWQPVWR